MAKKAKYARRLHDVPDVIQQQVPGKTKGFALPRWLVLTGRDEPLEHYAAAEAGAIIQQHVPYVLQTIVGDCDRDKLKKHNLMVIGTPETNRLIASLVADGKIRIPPKPQSYTITVLPSPYNSARQMLILAGADSPGVLYAVRDWEHYCYDPYATSLVPSRFPLPHAPQPVRPAMPRMVPFHHPIPAWNLSSSPRVLNRGIWTWGHVVYDYRRFLENMSRWKMNILIVWNDYAPVNARDITDYAHSLGIKLIWGFSWGWGELLNPNDSEQLAYWRNRVIDTYEQQYAPLGGDGIYFEIFTETESRKIGRKTVAELAARGVNHIGAALLERHPDLWIQWGLHATSVLDDIDYIKTVDPRINITWANVGSFPYDYEVAGMDNLEETLTWTRRLARLRGAQEDVGLTLKGMIQLDWDTFENQQGPFVMGRADRDFIRQRAELVQPRWKKVEIGWRKHFPAVCRTIKAALAARPKKLTITGLVEDGMWEERMPLPVCLLAEAMWNPDERPESIIAKVAATRDAYCLA